MNLFFLEIQCHNMIGVDILCPFLTIDTARSDQNICAAGIRPYFIDRQPVHMAVKVNHGIAVDQGF